MTSITNYFCRPFASPHPDKRGLIRHAHQSYPAAMTTHTPGKYDDACTQARTQTNAACIALIILSGDTNLITASSFRACPGQSPHPPRNIRIIYGEPLPAPQHTRAVQPLNADRSHTETQYAQLSSQQ